MPQLSAICEFLTEFAPPVLAEEWDNVGLLAGDPLMGVRGIMTCLTITPHTAQEAIDRGVDLVVTHHPLPFQPIRRLATDTLPGRLLWQLVTHRIAIYSPHTAFDSAPAGINQALAQGLELTGIRPLVPHDTGPEGTGGGRWGELSAALSLADLAQRLKEFLGIGHVQYVGDLRRAVHRVAVACGAAGSFLAATRQADCDVLVLGETNLHTCVEADASGTALLLAGHYASERFAVEQLAEVLAARFPDVNAWASHLESDPVRMC